MSFYEAYHYIFLYNAVWLFFLGRNERAPTFFLDFKDNRKNREIATITTSELKEV